ncbi:MAG: TIGR04282 family arsenosugar biosynthesis glycosyltransferase [Deltaproteobacteria bacterium]|nr:TIGR04282 family arsenosugar biosynthesis glycosyltransferase [Deltaproteobacteria bacterium]
MKSDALVVFGREPRPGKVKTRLAKQIGAGPACDLYKDLLNSTIEVCLKVDANRFLYLPEGDLLAVPDGSFSLRVQSGDDLGPRMDHAFCECFENGYARVVLVGSDCPYLSPSILRDAFSALDGCETVFGPAVDGGYYLVGQRAPARDLFSNIAFSCATVFRQTMSRLEENGWSYSVLPILEDIDDLASFERYIKRS